ncbi:MAG: sensor histidine kinase N-terminal domain-containing protein [Aquabacterium sp.]|uniref:ATP-binding protein n=1 Tax=Aquabacterium sp. TaxID=1872578 RepID=UPI0025B8F3AE|nr:ATP-binding protein [Aquabacterium sp.]MBI5926486.1 sensor histidine kinase N-terminal domain-containing protein [Aquabacterium sp.]
MRAPLSIQSRLLALVTTSVLAIWFVAIGLTWVDARHELDELLDSHLAQAAALLVAQQSHTQDDDDHHLDAPSLHRYAPKVAFQVFHEGRLALRTSNAPQTPMVAMAGRDVANDDDDDGAHVDAHEGYRTVEINGTRWRVFATRGAERDVQVYVGEQIDSRADILMAILHGMLWPILVALPLLMLAVWLAIRRGLLPLRQIRQTLEARPAHALAPIELHHTPADLSPLLQALNGLFGRISTLLESERRFTADAAHELRTPIAAIRTQAQVALAESQEVPRRHALQATLAGCDRATRLVEQLLTLSRLESGQALDLQPLDLAALTRQVMADSASQWLDKQQLVELDAPSSPCMVTGNATLLSTLIRNLIDNASRYSPAHAHIHLTLDRQPGHGLTLIVEDSGPGMNEADAARLGERFFRVLGNEMPGSGLGWSIVKRVTAVHHAEVRVARSPRLGGLRVEVTWMTPEPGFKAR